MAALKTIRKRITSVKATQKITRAMKMVAGARLNRAQLRITALRPYALKTHEILSGGYRVDVQFGIDYQNQAEITTSTRETFEAEVERRWRETSWAVSLVGVAVEYSAAGRSSLDYFVRVDLDGSQATDYAAQRRHLSSICVDVCNQNGWVIPFAQMTVHLAPQSEE